MNAKLDDWENGWFGIELGLDLNEIDSLIALLQMIKNDPEQHFHISSEYKGEGGIGDIEVYVKEEKAENNLNLFGKALAPGEEI